MSTRNPNDAIGLMTRTGTHFHRVKFKWDYEKRRAIKPTLGDEARALCSTVPGVVVTFGEFREKKKSRMACKHCWYRSVFA